ncbi:MAG: cystathionine beta-lyase [Pseudomonadota bacterium]|nr:cystathionine beta-lyase [Pseudomonadota bacterium]
MTKKTDESHNITPATKVVHASVKPLEQEGMANIPVFHTSTVMKPSLDDYRHARGKYDYGRKGTPTSEATEKAVADLYRMEDCVATPSGLSAICLGISAVLKAGDHALFPDSMYGSGRRFIDKVLPQMGVSVGIYDPCVTASELKYMIGENTRLIYLESPGSLTFEMQDIPALTKLAHDHDCLVAMDNTWATALYFDAVHHAIDIIIEAGTKYISGHSDVSMGFVVSSGKTASSIRNYAQNTGICVAPDEHYLAMRGMRTMAIRLRQSEENGLVLAQWLEQQPEVIQMLHPALPSHPGHHHWQRDFTGSCGLFGFVIDPDIPITAIDAMADGLDLFGIGASWGGHESLISQGHLKRTITDIPQGTLLRIYAGIEDKTDLLDDVKAGFDRMRGSNA